MKPFLGKVRPKGWVKRGAPKGNTHAKGCKCRGAFSYKYERHEDLPPAITRRDKREYLHANCVVLAAAIFGPWAEQWARDLLPAARQLDARGLQ
jgi:hypothetical protein